MSGDAAGDAGEVGRGRTTCDVGMPADGCGATSGERVSPPAPAPFGLVVEARGDTVTVRVSGELDIASAPDLGEELDRIAGSPPPRVVVDLAGVTFLGSAGLGVLVQARRDLSGHDTRLVLARPSPMLRRVFQIVHLDRTFEFDPPEPTG